MKRQNHDALYNLDYIEQQVKAIQAEQKANETTAERPRKEIDVLEEQLLTLQQIQIVLEKIEHSLSKKGWGKFF